MKGIVLAGGSGTRLYPVTQCISKQLLPVYDKPMIYYPLSVLMLAGIKDILIISTPEDTPRFEQLLGDGKKFGLSLSYAVQQSPDGLPLAFIIGENFIGKDNVALILGDNIFYGQGFTPILEGIAQRKQGATILGYRVKDPSRFGVVEFDEKSKKVISLQEKPEHPKTDYAVTGLYFYDNRVIEIAKSLKHSPRGEFEITDLNKIYLQEGNLNIEILGRGFAWLDTGTHDSLLQASQFIEMIDKRQGFKIGCLEEIAFRMNYISKEQLTELAAIFQKSDYGEYLLNIADKTTERNILCA